MKNFWKIMPLILCFPLCEQIISVCNSFTEFICSHLEYQSSKVKQKTAKIYMEQQQDGMMENTQAVGFMIPNEENYDEED